MIYLFLSERITNLLTGVAVKNKKMSNERLEHSNLYRWCKEQAKLYFEGKLEQEKIDKLNAIEFPWEYYK